LSAAVAAGALAATFVAAAPAAHATLPAGQVAVAAAGSDTTETAMDSIMADLDNRTVTVNSASVTERAYNIRANVTGSYSVPGDASCTDGSWSKDPLAPAANTAPTFGVSPFGSTAGRNYLAAENAGTGPGGPGGVPATSGAGCVDIARSSGAPRAAGGGDKSTFEYYAFALDAVSWATTSLKAPATLTRQQITDIYDCNITDWSQLPGGQAGTIKRYFPQAGSGTRSFFISDVLVGKASSYVPPAAGTGACSASNTLTLIEENEGQQIADADLDKAILPYSAAVWSFHAQNSINPTLDRRKGARLGGITTTAAVNASPVFWNGVDRQYQLDTAGVVTENNVKQANAGWSEAGGNYPGIRFVYNVLDNNGNRPGYQAAFQLVGFQNVASGAKGPLCDARPGGTGATEFAIILSNGFAPLSNTVNATSNLAGSTCRFYAGVN
jgi:ABC-type phosphate transport system substrate-binding protein